MLSLKLPQLLRVHQVPRVFWEDGIMSGYRRPTSSALDCVLSSFQMTNETVNIWTHFLPTWYFLWRLLALAGGQGFRSEPYHWPLLVFLLPACLYPFASCCAHTFSSMSPRARHICYFLDYGALSLYSLGCAFPYAAYSMPASWLHSRLHQLFVPAAALNSFLCTGLSCYSRFPELESPALSKILRTAAFTYPFLFDNLPLFYRPPHCQPGDLSFEGQNIQPEKPLPTTESHFCLSSAWRRGCPHPPSTHQVETCQTKHCCLQPTAGGWMFGCVQEERGATRLNLGGGVDHQGPPCHLPECPRCS
ncbi:membrane progestin receptor delta isoform X3 [Kogia breviceps]|uniref:membrane progestin receptor delta isoform X3 n=1 Tax=Kogia breviceps TaxID=27615 RepID=UPI0034D2601A